MQLFTTFSKHAMLVAILGATGLPASFAQAQFKVEYNENQKLPKATTVEKDETSTFVINSNDGSHSYELKLVNGAVKVARIDGDDLDDDQVVIKGEVVVFMSEDGKVLHEITVPGMRVVPGAPKAPFAVTQGQPMTWITESDAPNVKVGALRPKVMLGINLSEPSDAMRKQLRLGADQQVILVEKVIDGLPAKKAGLEDYDVILSIDGSDFANGELLTDILSKKNPGDELKLVLLRGGEKIKIAPKLTEYNAERLGVVSIEFSSDSDENLFFPAPNKPAAPGAFGTALLPQIHERLNKALSASGMSDKEIEKIQAQLHEQLGDLGNRFFFSNDDDNHFEFAITPHAEHEHKEHEIIELEREHMHQQEQAQRQRIEVVRNLELAELAKDKARQAMRDAERQIMEMRDGRLIVRSADQMQGGMEELEARLAKLESRLESQMEQFESQMDRMADLFERLMDRLEEDRD
jgi:hypothetical protein